MNVFDIYEIASLGQLKNKLNDYHSLPDEQKSLLNQIGYKSRLDKIELGIRANANVVRAIRSEGDGLLEDMEQEEQAREIEKLALKGQTCGNHHDHHSHDHNQSHSHNHHNHVEGDKPTPTQMEKLLSTIKQFVRDWSTDVNPILTSYT